MKKKKITVKTTWNCSIPYQILSKKIDSKEENYYPPPPPGKHMASGVSLTSYK